MLGFMARLDPPAVAVRILADIPLLRKGLERLAERAQVAIAADADGPCTITLSTSRQHQAGAGTPLRIEVNAVVITVEVWRTPDMATCEAALRLLRVLLESAPPAAHTRGTAPKEVPES